MEVAGAVQAVLCALHQRPLAAPTHAAHMHGTSLQVLCQRDLGFQRAPGIAAAEYVGDALRGNTPPTPCSRAPLPRTIHETTHICVRERDAVEPPRARQVYPLAYAARNNTANGERSGGKEADSAYQTPCASSPSRWLQDTRHIAVNTGRYIQIWPQTVGVKGSQPRRHPPAVRGHPLHTRRTPSQP